MSRTGSYIQFEVCEPHGWKGLDSGDRSRPESSEENIGLLAAVVPLTEMNKETWVLGGKWKSLESNPENPGRLSPSFRDFPSLVFLGGHYLLSCGLKSHMIFPQYQSRRGSSL